jgi:hypothetical protein
MPSLTRIKPAPFNHARPFLTGADYDRGDYSGQFAALAVAAETAGHEV